MGKHIPAASSPPTGQSSQHPPSMPNWSKEVCFAAPLGRTWQVWCYLSVACFSTIVWHRMRCKYNSLWFGDGNVSKHKCLILRGYAGGHVPSHFGKIINFFVIFSHIFTIFGECPTTFHDKLHFQLVYKFKSCARQLKNMWTLRLNLVVDNLYFAGLHLDGEVIEYSNLPTYIKYINLPIPHMYLARLTKVMKCSECSSQVATVIHNHSYSYVITSLKSLLTYT